MRTFKGTLITHKLSDSERLIEQKRLKAYLKGDERFQYKGHIYWVTPKPISSNPEESILPEIII